MKNKQIRQGQTRWAITIFRKHNPETETYEYSVGLWRMFIFQLKGQVATVQKSNATFKDSGYKNITVEQHPKGMLKIETYSSKNKAIRMGEELKKFYESRDVQSNLKIS